MENERNIVITGFMGTGKTAVGRIVARGLGRRFVDMDEEIERRAGKPIAHVFAENEERAFRQMENELCRELSGQRGLVIATGGGTLVNPENRKLLKKNGTIVCLTCEIDELLRRVSGESHRPLLFVADPRGTIERLLAERAPAYGKIPWPIDTTTLSREQVASRVFALVKRVLLTVHTPKKEYEIHIGPGMLAHLGGALRYAGIQEGRIAVVADTNVAPLYGEKAEDSLVGAGFNPFLCTIPAGEENKTLVTVSSLYEQFLAHHLDRSGTVLSLGGGVSGDIAGFAAATYMRGVGFVQVPTTLLAMVDASVGGKTGIDLPQGKNLVGAFYQPRTVVIDLQLLRTLPREEICSGLAEVIKHGIIGDAGLFSSLEGRYDLDAWKEDSGSEWIARALRVKIAVVEEDPFEQGRRAVLNFGHTVGHALERLSSYSLRHGEAVSVGMVAAARIAVKLGQANSTLAERIAVVLAGWGLPVRCPPFSVDEIWEALSHDKKRHHGSLRWVIPIAIGAAKIVTDLSPQVVKEVLQQLGARS
jgi:3-dehydroquinate synthase